MSQGDQPQLGRVVTGRGAGRGLKFPVIVVATVVLAALGGGTFYLVKYGPLAPKPAAPSTQNLTPAQKLAAAQRELAGASTPKEKATAYTHLGEAYFDSNQTDQAINAYKQALATGGDKSGSDSSSSSSGDSTEILALGDLAIAYQKAGNIAEQIKAIEQLIPLLEKSSDPDAKRLVFRYQQLLDGLKAQQ